MGKHYIRAKIFSRHKWAGCQRLRPKPELSWQSTKGPKSEPTSSVIHPTQPPWRRSAKDWLLKHLKWSDQWNNLDCPLYGMSFAKEPLGWMTPTLAPMTPFKISTMAPFLLIHCISPAASSNFRSVASSIGSLSQGSTLCTSIVSTASRSRQAMHIATLPEARSTKHNILHSGTTMPIGPWYTVLIYWVPPYIKELALYLDESSTYHAFSLKTFLWNPLLQPNLLGINSSSAK